MLVALGSPSSLANHVEAHQDDEGNVNAHSNLFNLNLNFKEFKLSLPLSGVGFHPNAKTSPTLPASLDLPLADASFSSTTTSTLSSSSSFSAAMASPKVSRKTTHASLSAAMPLTNTSGQGPQQVQPNLLNKSATKSTGIYQQSVLLRSRLQRLPPFAQFLEFSHSGLRATRDVVQQLWETFALGKPLCVLFNLQEIPATSKILEYADGIVDPDPLRKERQRAIALFIMGANNLKTLGFWDKDAPLFSISELVGDTMDTNGFVKVVATVLYLLDRLPLSIWSNQTERPCTNAMSSHEPVSTLGSRADIERANLVRELIETERKYCQDLEIMQSYAESLRERNIVDADTIHKLFPALGKLTDFQRKLLIHMEATAEHSLDDQDWGRCFATHEAEFSIYDAYIANYSNALDLAVAEQRTLVAASNIINPMQLPAFLIKPVQRLCRYPMLLGSLLKLTPTEHVLHASLIQGVAAVKRIADGANRALREKENTETWEQTLARIRDWKGLHLDKAGPLLLDDLFSVIGENRPYSEYHVFLFNRMLLLCRPKEAQLEADPSDKEKKSDKLTSSFKRSQNAAPISLAILPPTPSSATPSSFFASGAVASRRAKTPLSIRGTLYVRNILEIHPEPYAPYAIQIKYRDNLEVNNWTFNCRNEEQVNLWYREITRLMDLWKVDEKEIRRSAKATLQAMKDQMIVSHPSVESLDTMRSARRPTHPYHYTFEAGPTRTRARNGSLNLDGKPDLDNGVGRNRSCSVTSVASDAYDSRGYAADRDIPQISSHLSRSAVELAVSPGAGSNSGDRSATSSHDSPSVFHSAPSSRTHSRTPSQSSAMSIGTVPIIRELPKPVPGSSHTRLSGRIRTSPLPPQLPPPTGPQPLPPVEDFLGSSSVASYAKKTGTAPGDVKPLPVPPSASNLRQRVGARLPAPLVPATPSTPVEGTGTTPQSTLPELPSKEIRRPLSNRKSSTPLRGPRERGQTARTPLTANPHQQGFDVASHPRSRSLSNPLVDNMDPRKIPGKDTPAIVHTVRHRHRRQGSESSSYTTDSVSILTTSDGPSQDGSPVTPLSFGEESKHSPTKNGFNGQDTDHNRLREPHLVSDSGHPMVRRVVSGSNLDLDLLESPPAYYAGATPKSAYHSSKEVKPILTSGIGYSDPNLAHSRRSGHTHTRSISATGLGRTGADTSLIAVRLHYDSSRFILKMPHTTSRREFVERVRQKIRMCGAAPVHSIPYEQLDPKQFASEEWVSYLNDSNMFVPLDSDWDFAMAWRSVKCRRRDPADDGVLILGVGPMDYLGYAS